MAAVGGGYAEAPARPAPRPAAGPAAARAGLQRPSDEALDSLVRVLSVVRASGPRSRSELEARTGLGRGIVAQRVGELLAMGLVVEDEVMVRAVAGVGVGVAAAVDHAVHLSGDTAMPDDAVSTDGDEDRVNTTIVVDLSAGQVLDLVKVTAHAWSDRDPGEDLLDRAYEDALLYAHHLDAAELAPVYVLLASDEASYVSGARIAVTGGKPIL